VKKVKGERGKSEKVKRGKGEKMANAL
jgi:hypothetical protein